MHTGVASYGTLGHVPHLDIQLFNFFWSLQSHINFEIGLLCGFLPRKSIQAYSFATVYCMNFIIFLFFVLKFFYLSFVPLLAPSPGDATVDASSLCYDVDVSCVKWRGVHQFRVSSRHPTDRTQVSRASRTALRQEIRPQQRRASVCRGV